jgi:alanine racemase
VGVNPTEQAHLETVGTLKTTISQIKHLVPGQTVGYGRRGRIERDSAIATLAIGYADGFDRRLGNGNGQVWIDGSFAPTIGSVCMDMTMVDITGIPAQEGDEVVVFGAALPVSELARQCGTIPYEIMTGISDRVKRVFYSG